MNKVASSDLATELSLADLSEPAEVFVSRGIGRRSGLGYHRFSKARDAIEFAVETFPSARSDGVVMVVGNKRFNLGTIRTLHRDQFGEAGEEAGENVD